MRPTVGRVVLYTVRPATPAHGDQPGDSGVEYAATITAVRERDGASQRELLAGDENAYDVLMAVHRHGFDTKGSIWHTASPIRYAEKPAANTWRWPPRA